MVLEHVVDHELVALLEGLELVPYDDIHFILEGLLVVRMRPLLTDKHVLHREAALSWAELAAVDAIALATFAQDAFASGSVDLHIVADLLI